MLSSGCFLTTVLICVTFAIGIGGKSTNTSRIIPNGAKSQAPGFRATTEDTRPHGSGFAYAESCQAALRAWSSSSSCYGREHGHRSTSLYTSHMTVKSIIGATREATSLITLCDGYPRVVGKATSSGGETSAVDMTWTNTNPTLVFASYTTPAPCSINPEDCKLLYNSWTSHYNELMQTSKNAALLNPPCTTRTPTQTYSTNSNGDTCDNCQVIGSKIRLLYWPVVTRSGVGNLCNQPVETITASPTGDGPNIFVTNGITIASPTVAVSIGGVSRVDKCGTTVAQTIIPVLPEDVSSVNGARALFTHKPFNFADLNYKCMSDPDAIFVTDAGRDDCYQEVPASAYFYGYANAAGVDWYRPDAFVNSTIWPNYQPQVLPPMTMTEAIRSLWDEDCNIHPDGVWDPPIALGQESSIRLPNAGPNAPTQYFTPTSDPAIPAAPTLEQVSETHSQGAAMADSENTDPAWKGPAQARPTQKRHAVHVVHATVLTKSAVGGGDVLTHTIIGGHNVLANDKTTVALVGGNDSPDAKPTAPGADTELSFGPAAVQTPSGTDFGRVSGQVFSIGSDLFTVDPIGNNSFEVKGRSTTLQIAWNHAQTTRRPIHHTDTKDPLSPSITGDASVGARASPSITGDVSATTQTSPNSSTSSASGSGVERAVVTSMYLALLAVCIAVFL